jgi:hypothetical protein
MGAKSRNAVVGKLYRLGLRGRIPINGITNIAKPAKRRSRSVFHRYQGDKVSEPEPTPPFVNPKLLIELTATDCRYPGSGRGAAMLYCAAPALKGYSYCAHHCAIAYTRPGATPRPPRQ